MKTKHQKKNKKILSLNNLSLTSLLFSCCDIVCSLTLDRMELLTLRVVPLLHDGFNFYHILL